MTASAVIISGSMEGISIGEDISIDGIAPTGIAGLDNILRGGFPAHRMYLIQGDPGVGKTTLALQFLLEGVSRGERVLYISLSETSEELDAVARSHNWSLEGIDLFELSSMEEYLSIDGQNSVFHHSEVELKETTQALFNLIEGMEPTRVVFDSLSEVRLLAREALKYRFQILSLKQFFADKKCTVLLLDDMTSTPGDLQLRSICHGVILMEQYPMSYGVDRRRVRVQKLRGVDFRSGYHDMNMAKGGITVFPRLIALEHRQDVAADSLPSGIATLDEMLEGGLDRGVSTLLLGPAGSGKSTISIYFALEAAKRGEKAILYSFEETARTLFRRLKGLGIDLQSYIDSGAITIRYIDPAELTPGEFVHMVREDVASGEVAVVVIDSLNGYLNAMPEERFLVLQLHELFSYLGQIGVSSVLVVAQHGLMGTTIGTPVDVSYLADTVILFRIFESHGKLRQALSIAKRRAGKHDRSIREIQFERETGIGLGEPLDHLRGIFTGTPVPVPASEAQ